VPALRNFTGASEGHLLEQESESPPQMVASASGNR